MNLPTQNLQCDVLVIGAGPAGCCAAISAARAGSRTVLVEKAVFPREKVCGCCLSPAGLLVLSELDAASHRAALTTLTDTCSQGSLLQTPQTHSLLHTLRATGTPLIAARIKSCSHSARFKLGTQDGRHGIAISRSVLDSELLVAARCAGVHVISQHLARVQSEGSASSPALATLQSLTRESELANATTSTTCAAQCIIVCDGLAGTSLPQSGYWKTQISASAPIGLGSHVASHELAVAMHSLGGSHSELHPGEILMHVARDGYVGLVRMSDDMVSLACALRSRHMARTPARESGVFAQPPHEVAANIVAHACNNTPAPQVLLELFASLRWRGAPQLTRSRASGRSRIIVAGDAQAYVEPFSGEGMTWALQTGKQAGIHAHAVASGTLALEHSADHWRDTLHDVMQSRHTRCRVLATLARSPRVVAGACVLASALPAASALLQRGLAGLWSTEPLRLPRERHAT